MRIAVIGAGAVGCVIAGYLLKAGRDITLVGKDGQVAAIKNDGLRLTGIRGESVVKFPLCHRLQEEYDLVIFTTQTQDLEEAYQQNCDYLENCHVLTLQSGVQAENILSSHFDRDKILIGSVGFGATCINSGEVILHFEGLLTIGKAFTKVGPFVQNVAEELNSAFEIVVAESVVGMKWVRLLTRLHDSIAVLLGKPDIEVFIDDELCVLSLLLLKEALPIVKSSGAPLVSLPDFSVDQLESFCSMPMQKTIVEMKRLYLAKMDKSYTNPMLQSIFRGKTSEVDFINGEIVALASGLRTKAPLNDLMLELIHQLESSGKFLSVEEVKGAFQLSKLTAMER